MTQAGEVLYNILNEFGILRKLDRLIKMYLYKTCGNTKPVVMSA
jgi:hypothetical protein